MSVTKTFNITLDVTTPLSNEEFRVKQGDTGNVFVITLVDDGEPVDLTNCRVVALFTKGSRLAMQDNWTDDGSVTIGGTNNNIITIELFNGSFVPGLNECEIQVYSGDELDVLVTSSSFNFRCARSLINEETIISMQEYTLLTSLIATVQAIANGAQVDWNQANNLKPDYIKNKPTSFSPSAHAASHATGGADAITPSSIGAAAADAFNAHAARHASGGADAVSPASIGACTIQAVTKTLTTAGWSGSDAPYSQQLLVNEIAATSHILAFPASGFEEAYSDGECKATAQEARKITFTCESKPEAAVNVNLLIFT